MLKKISFLVVVILTALFLVQPASKPARAAVLNWEPMVNSTFPSGVRSPGFGDTDNFFAQSMVTFADYVYVSNYNIGAGTEIWRSNNGADWEQVNVDNFGNTAKASYAVLAVFDGHLYAFNYLVGDGITDFEDHVDVYRYNSGTSWENTAPMTIGNAQAIRTDPFAAVTYNNTLYISLINGTDTGSAIYGSTDGTTWTASNTDGFGNDNNAAVYSMAVYNNYLYAGTYNPTDGTEIWRFDGSTWVIDNTNGFNNTENSTTGTLTSFGGTLYASTDNSTTGAEVWKSSGGVNDWAIVSDTGFGQDTAVVSTTGSTVFKGKLYIGTSSLAKVFRSSDGTSWEQVNEDHFGYSDNLFAIFTVLGDYLYAGTGNLNGADRGFAQGDIVIEGDTTEIYRYYEPSATTLPETGFNSPLHAYILDALL